MYTRKEAANLLPLGYDLDRSTIIAKKEWVNRLNELKLELEANTNDVIAINNNIKSLKGYDKSKAKKELNKLDDTCSTINIEINDIMVYLDYAVPLSKSEIVAIINVQLMKLLNKHTPIVEHFKDSVKSHGIAWAVSYLEESLIAEVVVTKTNYLCNLLSDHEKTTDLLGSLETFYHRCINDISRPNYHILGGIQYSVDFAKLEGYKIILDYLNDTDVSKHLYIDGLTKLISTLHKCHELWIVVNTES